MPAAAANDWVTAPLPPAATDDGVPSITVRPQGSRPLNAGNEGGGSSAPAGPSQPHVSNDDWVTRPAAAPSSGFSVTPPPPDKAPVVEAAAKQYGVPLNVAHFVGSRESGWRDDATGIPTSSGRAQGAWQFMPGTAKEYGLANPNDFPTATAAAMHKLADLAAKNGGDWEKAVAQYGTFSTGQGADKDAAVRQSFRDYMGDKTPVAQDVAQGVGRGLIQGAGYVLGMPSDIWHMLDRGYQWALTKGAEKLGMLSPEEGEELRAPSVGTGEDEPSSLGSEKINTHLMRLAQMGGADVSQPFTGPGKAAETISSFVPGAATLGASALRLAPMAAVKYGLVPGTLSEAGGQLTEGTPAEPYVRAGLAAIGSAPAIAMDIAKARSVAATARTMSTADPAHIAAAQSLVDEARAAGAPLTLPEALKYASQGATDLTGVQRIVEQSPGGGGTMSAFYAQRPAQTEQLGRGAMDAVAPPVTDPYSVGPRVQGAANQTVSDAATTRTIAVDPYYRAAATDRVPQPDMEAFLGQIDRLIAQDKTGIVGPSLAKLRDSLTETPARPGQPAQRVARTTPTGGTIYSTTPAVPPTPRVPITDIENLDRARKEFRDLIANPPWAQNAIPKETGAKMSSLLGDLRTMMESNSPNFAAGRQAYENISRSTFEPLARSPTGQLAVTDQFPKQAQILFNHNPLPGSEQAVAKAVRDVARTDPDAARELVRMHMEQTFNEATQKNIPGANQWGGPKFAAVLAGNPQQAANLEAAIRALPQGDLRWNSFQKALKIMEAQGTRQAAGSMTDMNSVIRSELKKGTPIGEIVATVGSPTRGLKWISEAYDNLMYRRNTAELARVFTSGNVDDLREIALRAPGSFRARAALVTALSREQGARGEPEGYASGGGVDADQTGNSMLRGMPRSIEQSPDWGAAYSSSIDAVKAARAESMKQGLLDPDTGLPTQAGLVDAAKQYANGMLMGSTAPKGIVAYHGSPHMFDKFDLAKIGTGEGAQAYGHGLYFAGNEGVAKTYKTSRGISPQLDEINGRLSQLAKIMDKDAVPGAYRKFKSSEGSNAADEYDALMTKRSDLGHMYEVNLNVDPKQLLDWDKPLSGQGKQVQDALGKLNLPQDPNLLPTDTGSAILKKTHFALYDEASGAPLDNVRRSEDYLAGAGIPGIKYLDQGSRGAGQGTSNYVMFNPDLINIVRRYAIPGALLSGTTPGLLASSDGSERQRSRGGALSSKSGYARLIAERFR